MGGATPAEAAECFRACYRNGTSDAQLRLERAVFGSDYGADGWATVQQIDQLARRLGLRPEHRVLDIGTGRGWPGLYLARTTRCTAVLTDQFVEGLSSAVARALRDHVADQVSAAAATAPTLPFRANSFDAIVHTDVLCCLGPKLQVLRETRRVLRPSGRTAFYVIHLAPGLSGRERRRAVEVGPFAVATRGRGYESMLRSAGFGAIEQVDVTAAYAQTQRAWLRHAHTMADELAAAEPAGAFAQRFAEHLAAADAVDDGLLRRSMFVARR